MRYKLNYVLQFPIALLIEVFHIGGFFYILDRIFLNSYHFQLENQLKNKNPFKLLLQESISVYLSLSLFRY